MSSGKRILNGTLFKQILSTPVDIAAGFVVTRTIRRDQCLSRRASCVYLQLSAIAISLGLARARRYVSIHSRRHVDESRGSR